jgi:hypothetical protein
MFLSKQRPPLWSSGQNFWLQIQRSRVWFPALPDFLRSSVSIIGELLEWKNSRSGSRKSRLLAVGIRCADHATPSIRKSWPTSGGRSVGIVRLLTRATEFSFFSVSMPTTYFAKIITFWTVLLRNALIIILLFIVSRRRQRLNNLSVKS